MKKSTEGKVAIVTGAGSGIGAAAARKLAAEGIRVGLMDIAVEKLEAVKTEIEKNGGQAIALSVNIAEEDMIVTGIEQVHKQWGRLDILFTNAGINGRLSSIEEFEVEEWDKTINTNLRSTFLFVKYCIPYLKKDGGSIIMTSSINGNRRFSGFGMSAYSASKAGQVGFMKMAALELARYKIRVNAICPGAIQTNIDNSSNVSPSLKEIEIPVIYPEGAQPLAKGPGSPEQVADLVYFLATDASGHISGTEIYIDGAESLL